MPQDAPAILQETLGEADALILQRLKDRALELPHLANRRDQEWPKSPKARAQRLASLLRTFALAPNRVGGWLNLLGERPQCPHTTVPLGRSPRGLAFARSRPIIFEPGDVSSEGPELSLHCSVGAAPTSWRAGELNPALPGSGAAKVLGPCHRAPQRQATSGPSVRREGPGFWRRSSESSQVQDCLRFVDPRQ
jgi:hypothetical protein